MVAGGKDVEDDMDLLLPEEERRMLIRETINKSSMRMLTIFHDLNILRLYIELNGFPLTRTKSVQSPASVLRNKKQN